MSRLFTPVELGSISLSHRVAMAPLTRLRAGAGDVPGLLMAEHYEQRATEGGLIIAEAAAVSENGIAYAGAPGIYNRHHIEGWRRVTDRVHDRGGRIVLQLFHSGRTSHPVLQPKGGAPVAPSAIAGEGQAFTRQGWVTVAAPRALETSEIGGLIEDFRLAGARAMAAGFDGVELHSANGYLPDQFLHDGSNRRTDEYGGTIAKRARFTLEATQALVSVWGADRVGVRLSPSGTHGEMADSDPEALFGYVAAEHNQFKLAYLHVIEPRMRGDTQVNDEQVSIASAHLRKIFNGPMIAAGGFTLDSANAILDRGDTDVVAFGRYFTSNPDLVERLRKGRPLAPYDRATFWGGDGQGYSDFPRYATNPAVDGDLVPAQAAE